MATSPFLGVTCPLRQCPCCSAVSEACPALPVSAQLHLISVPPTSRLPPHTPCSVALLPLPKGTCQFLLLTPLPVWSSLEGQRPPPCSQVPTRGSNSFLNVTLCPRAERPQTAQVPPSLTAPITLLGLYPRPWPLQDKPALSPQHGLWSLWRDLQDVAGTVCRLSSFLNRPCLHIQQRQWLMRFQF